MKVEAYINKHKWVNIKKGKNTYKYDPCLPFQNIKLSGKGDYFIVPTQNPNRKLDMPTMPIGLTVERIGNPSLEKRTPERNVAIPIN